MSKSEDMWGRLTKQELVHVLAWAVTNKEENGILIDLGNRPCLECQRILAKLRNKEGGIKNGKN